MTELIFDRSVSSEDKRVIGVLYTAFSLQTISAFVRREVILSAGFIGSPKILQLSGIGPADTLSKAGIRIEVELEGVVEVKPCIQNVFAWSCGRGNYSGFISD